MHRQGRAGTFAETHAEVDEGISAEGSEHPSVRTLIGSMREKAKLTADRLDQKGSRRSRSRDKSVDDRGQPVGGRFEDRSGHRGDFVAAHRFQPITGRDRTSAMLPQCTGNGFRFALDARCRNARPPAHDVPCVQA